MEGMESRWYLAPGQTLYNTNISDRQHALHVTKTAWKKINAHLDRNRIIAETLEKERAYKKAMKEGSEAMTKNWDDSIERAHNKKVEERKQRAKAVEEEKYQKYLELTKEQEEIKRAFIEKVNNEMYYSKAYPKMLNGALMESEAIYERQKQMEFKEMIKAHDREEEMKYAERIKQAAEDEKRENEEKRLEEYKKRRAAHDANEKEMQERKEFIKYQREKRKQKQILDNINQQKEMELQEQIQQEDVRKIRDKRRKELLDYMAEDRAIKARIAKEEAEVDEVIKIFDEAKRNIDCLRKEKEKEILRETIERREAGGKKVYAVQMAKDEAFLKAIETAQEEAARREEEKHQKEIEKRLQIKKEREDDRREHMEREEKARADDKEMMRWDMLNRQKQEAVTKEYLEEKRKQEWQNVLAYRETLLEQIEERKAQERKEKEDLAKAEDYVEAEMEDKRFFDYANSLVEYCAKKERPTYPILKVIQNYKHNNGLEERRDPKCADYDKYAGRREKFINTTPGKMRHYPRSDPNYGKCPCRKERLYK